MKTLQSILPTTSGAGGTRVGSTFIDDWSCKFYWYANHLAPFEGGNGLTHKHDNKNLWMGSVTHTALETWVRSGWSDGKFDPEATEDALEQAAEEASTRLAFPEEEHPDLLAQCKKFMGRYMKFAGPDGEDPDWEQWRPVEANGEPIIEREFEVDLQWEGFFYTTKPDVVVWRLSDGALCALDHKTCSASNAGLTIAGMRKRPQLTGEHLAMRLVWPNETTGVMVNAIIKNAAATKPPRRLEDMDRNEARLGLFRIHTISKLKEMEEHIERYRDLMQQGVPEPEAARLVFDDEPTDQLCSRFNRTCQYLDSCISAEPVVDSVGFTMKPRYVKGVRS